MVEGQEAQCRRASNSRTKDGIAVIRMGRRIGLSVANTPSGLCFAAYSYLGESQLNRVAIIAPDFCDRTSQTVRSWDTLARAVEDLELWPQRQAPARADFREQRQGVRALPFLAQCHTLSPNTPSETDPINSRLYRLRPQSRMRPTLTSYTANGGGHRLPKGPSGLSVRPTDPYFRGTHPRPTAPRARQPLW
jgi:hypothetical protein